VGGPRPSRDGARCLAIEGAAKDDDGHRHFVVSLAFDEAAWNRRRSTDRVVLLVAHPDLPQGATEMVALYRAKDAVEKDFQTIKRDLELRSVFHHTDPKVRARQLLARLRIEHLVDRDQMAARIVPRHAA
jgi:hypothetical protein